MEKPPKLAELWRPSGKVFAATGHRPNKLMRFDDKALLYLADRYCRLNCPSYGISGMALGWDTVWASVLTELGVPWGAAVPFEGQESTWHKKDQKRYHELLSQASTVHIVCKGDYAAWKFQKRNEYMVNNSNIIVALWDGSSGGTCNCIRYADRCKKPVENLWEQALAL